MCRDLTRTLAILVILLPTAAFADLSFDDHFVDRTMRLDYFHTGGLGDEIFSVDEHCNNAASWLQGPKPVGWVAALS